MVNLRSITLLLLLITSVIGTWALNRYLEQLEIKNTTALSSGAIFFMKDVQFYWTNARGERQGMLKAPEARHIDANNTIICQHPELTLFSANHGMWLIEADSAVEDLNQHQLLLTGHVMARQSGASSEKNMILTTGKLMIYPKSQIAVSDEPVTVTQSNGSLKATGLYLDWKKGTLELKSHAQAEYTTEISNRPS